MNDIQRLHAAFADLNGQGIRTYDNHWCCSGCASGAIANAYDASPEQGGIIGAVYYHELNAEAAINGYGLTLHYGALPQAWDDGDDETRGVGQKLVEALTAHGLTPKWNGDPSTCVEIPRFEVTLEQIPEGEGSGLHFRDEDEGWH